jgi:hypothetical protein
MGDQAQSDRGSRPLYRAFISYSHADARFAQRLHRRLERMRLPSVPGQPRERLAPVFIDRAELAAGSDLTAQVRDALAASAALVVVASPAARTSRWVAQEIALFRQIHPHRPVLAALIDGEPDEAFPDALLHAADGALEPLAADFRKGRDGERLGLLKLAAGLTALPLDRLVQRDALARQRRVMAVTAASLLLSLVLAALLAFALRARAEAERQRGEAEGLVEFMLTDLRDKLKGVGRLDVMDAVNERAMAHYAGQDPANLPDEALLRRARLLQAMGEDDLSTLGQRPRGQSEIEEAWRVTADALRRKPEDPEVLFAHAQSEYWLGYAKFIDRSQSPERRREAVSKHWLENGRLTTQLVAQSPQNARWQAEASYSAGNLCVLELSEPANPQRALPYCRNAAERLEHARQLRPNDIEIGLNLLSAIAWQADAEAAVKKDQEALASRRRQSRLADELTGAFPADHRTAEALLLARIGLGKQLVSMKRIAEARSELAQARELAARLRRQDPGNQDWSAWAGQIARLEAASNQVSKPREGNGQ